MSTLGPNPFVAGNNSMNPNIFTSVQNPFQFSSSHGALSTNDQTSEPFIPMPTPGLDYQLYAQQNQVQMAQRFSQPDQIQQVDFQQVQVVQQVTPPQQVQVVQQVTPPQQVQVVQQVTPPQQVQVIQSLQPDLQVIQSQPPDQIQIQMAPQTSQTVTTTTTVLQGDPQPLLQPYAPGSWFWKDDHHMWQPYDPIQSLTIEQGFMAGYPNVKLTVGIFANKNYIVNFQTMRQECLDRMAVRSVLRRGGPLPPTIWLYEDNGVMKPYDIITSQYLDKCLVDGHSSVRLITGWFAGKNYIADLINFQQVNLDTKAKRMIQKPGYNPPGVSPQTNLTVNRALISDPPPTPDPNGDWEWLDDNMNWVSYDTESQKIIQQAIKKGKKSVILSQGWYGRHGSFKINFKKMEQKSCNGKKRQIRTRPTVTAVIF